MTETMMLDNTNLQEYIEQSGTVAEILTMKGRVHSVAAASEQLGVSPDHIIKTVVFRTSDQELILAIVKGEHRASSKRIAKALRIEPPTLATPEEALELTGYKVGGTPPISVARAQVLIDPHVMMMENVIGGGGTDYHLLRISPDEILRVTGGRIARVRK
ncbi:MAG: aminoacyl-tRNA deacylase [Candidatus Thorarchaeota archaeon]